MPGGRVCKKTIAFSLSTFLCLQNVFFIAQHLCLLARHLLRSTSSFACSGIRHKYNATAAQMLVNFSHQPSLKGRFILLQLVKILFSWGGTGTSALVAYALRFRGCFMLCLGVKSTPNLFILVKYPEWKDLRRYFPSTPENLLSEVREMIHATNSRYNGKCVTSPCDLVNLS